MKSRMEQLGLFSGEPERSGGSGWVASAGARLIRVAFESAGDNLFDYAVPEGREEAPTPGQRVRAPLGKGNRTEVGFCVEVGPEPRVDKVKYIEDIMDAAPLLDESMLELARWMAVYYCCSLGVVLAAMVPAAVKKQVGTIKRAYVCLTEKGQSCLRGEDEVRLSSKGRAILSYFRDQGEMVDSRQGGGGTGRKESKTEGKKSETGQASEIGPVLLTELTEQAGCGAGPIQTLVKLGLAEVYRRRELSSPRFPTEKPGPAAVFHLNDDQEGVLAQIQHLMDRQAFEAILLHGVTGSGKTEIYMRCIERVLRAGRQALVLVPEIAMTPQTVNRFLERFARVAVLHSGLSAPQRHQHWRWIADGEADVVVGARSAVFAPLSRLGLIVVDEEHEPSYKQDTAPRYHGRDVAIKRGQLQGISVVLGSATPSLESLHNCRTRTHYHLLRLPRRVMNLPLPEVSIVNMRTEALQRKGNHLLSRRLEAELKRCLERKKQAILLLNRRGHSTYIFCPSCNFILSCPNCDVTLTYHQRRGETAADARRWVMCHHCLHSSEVPERCAVCGKTLRRIGPGTQRAEEEILRKFPGMRLQRVDSDATKPRMLEGILADFGAGRIDGLIGTQMVGKGLDFPNVELVGVLHADTALSLPDFRSTERTFQLVAQVAGRCGRAEGTGRAVVQSFVPEEPAIQYACRHDYEAFAEEELEVRRRCGMPPFRRLARIILRDEKLAKLEVVGKRLRAEIDGIISEAEGSVEARGPIPAAIARLERYHRQEILLKAPQAGPLQRLLSRLRTEALGKLGVQAVVDVDPINLL